MELPDVKAGDDEADDDFVAIIPSQFFEQNRGNVIIDFTRYDTSAWTKIEDYSLQDLPQYNGRYIESAIDGFCKDFARVIKDEMFTNVPRAVAEFFQYLQNVAYPKAAYQLACNWPPCIPRSSSTVPSFVVLCCKILNKMKDPIKFLHYCSIALFPKNWTSKSSLVNQYLVACMRCHVDKKKPTCYAYIDRDRNFILMEITSKGQLKEKLNVTPGKTSQNSEKTLIHVYDFMSKHVVDLVPYEQDQIVLWDLIFSKQKVPFPFYLTSVDEVIPDIYYRAFYNAITANDMIITTAITRSSDFSPELWESIIKIYAHAEKIVFLITGVLAAELDKIKFVTTDFFENDSHLKLFFRGMGRVYWDKYYDEFFSKIVAMVDSHDDLEMSDISLIDVKITEKLIFNVLKYVSQSFAYVPMEWRFVMNIIRNYTLVKWNSKAITTFFLSGFIGKCIICDFFNEPDKWIRDIPLAHKDNFPTFGFLLSTPFTLNLYGGPTQLLAGSNRRLENHFFPRWYEFLQAVSDCYEVVTYDIPSKESLGWALDVALRHVSNMEMQQIVKDRLVEFMDANRREVTTVGLNYAVILANHFIHLTDATEAQPKRTQKKKVITKPVKLPHMKMFVGGAGGGGGGGRGPTLGAAMNETVSVSVGPKTAPTERYEEAEFYVGRGISITARMELPNAPPATVFNPINVSDTETETDESSIDTLTRDDDLLPKPPRIPMGANVRRIERRLDDVDFVSEDSDDIKSMPKAGQRPPPGLAVPPMRLPPPSPALAPPRAPEAPPPSVDMESSEAGTHIFDQFLETQSERPMPGTVSSRAKGKAVKMVKVDVDDYQKRGEGEKPKVYKIANESTGKGHVLSKQSHGGNKFVIKP